MDKFYKDKDAVYYEHSRPELLPFVPTNVRKVLDVGCGKGNFGKLLKEKFNCIVWGIEPDEKSAEEAAKVIDYAFKGFFDAKMVASLTAKYDSIFFNDVFEHLADPEEALELCKTILAEDGVIVTSIPNIRFFTALQEILFNKDFPYQESGILDKTHLRFFTKKSILRMFEQNGYNVLSIEPINIHEITSRKMNVMRFFFRKWLDDIDVLQYAVVAKPID